MKFIREKTVAFSGIGLSDIINDNGDCNLPNVISSETFEIVMKLCDKGYDTFLAGVNEGFELIAGEAILKAQELYPEIKIIIVSPSPEHRVDYCFNTKARYEKIYKYASERIFASLCDGTDIFKSRDKFLVDNSSVLVSYYILGNWNKTTDTVKVALRTGMEIINVRNSLLNYINDNSPNKKELLRYSYLKQLSVEKDKIIIDKESGEPTVVYFDEIKSVKNVSARLHITLNNNTQLFLSTISGDVKMKLAPMNVSFFAVVRWKISKWFCTLFCK